MPGKSSQGSQKGKQDSSKDRLTSANTRLGRTLTYSTYIFDNSEVGKKITIWPEWTDAELAAEKWELGGGGGKGRDKGKVTPHSATV